MCEKRFTNVSMGREEAYCDFSIIKVGDKIISEIPTTDAIRICDLLNEQQDTIITLKRRLEKINGGYGHLTHRNGLTANEWLIQSQEKEIKKKDEQISRWIEQHSKDIAKISEQNKLIQELKEENEKLKEEIETLK